jgi:hypothetical protein
MGHFCENSQLIVKPKKAGLSDYIRGDFLQPPRQQRQRVAANSMAAPIADTGYELYAACETVWDLDQLYSDLGMVHYISTVSILYTE